MKQLNWYQIFGKSNIPDGRTVLPTDDIQIWLNCANIWDKTYTRLAEVLADSATLSALMASNNAVDYLVRSTSWAVPITIPVMTDNTHPSGEAFGNSEMSGYSYYKAFDNNNTTCWAANNGTTGYIGYDFGTVSDVAEYFMLPDQAGGTGSGSTACRVKDYTIEGSNDKVSWDVLISKQYVATNFNGDSYSISGAYRYYRCNVISNYATGGGGWVAAVRTLQLYSPSITTSADAMTFIGQNNYCANTLLANATWCEAISNSEYFESVLNVKVPTMTSNTTPEGVVSAYNYNYSNYPWHAFDGDSTTTSDMWASENLSTWIQYKFTTPKKIKCVRFRQFWSAGYQITAGIIKASDDGANFTDVKSFTNDPSLSYKYIYLNSNEESYSYWRMHITAINSGAASLNELQFYGREDV